MGQITKTERLVDYGNGPEGAVEFTHSDLLPRTAVTVYIASHFGGPLLAQVNWSALGSVDPKVAKAYAEIMTSAAEYAADYNNGS